MADISKVVLPNDSNTYDIISKQTRGVIVCNTDSSSTASELKVTVNGVSSLYNGLTLLVRNSTTSSTNANCTFKVNNLNAKNLRLPTETAYPANYWGLGQSYFVTYRASPVDAWVILSGKNTDMYMKVYRCVGTSNPNTDYPLLVSYQPLSSIGTSGTNFSSSDITGRVNDDATLVPMLNPSTGMIKAKSLTANITNSIVDSNDMPGHMWTTEQSVHDLIKQLFNEVYNDSWSKYYSNKEISLSNLYVTGLAYSSKYVEGSIYLSKPLDSQVDISNTTLSGGKVALYGANGQILASTATYPTYSLSVLRDLGAITVKFTLSTNFNTNNNNKPALIWFDSGAKLTLG